jgi:DNA-binding transcriptional LysR family regulator
MQLRDRIGRRIKLHDLHVLLAVTEAGSMNKAAALLRTTQPAVSKSIAELEASVGVRLLDRNPRGVEPTEYGRVLLSGSTAMFDELRLAVKNIEFLADPMAGEIRIGCNALLASGFVSAIVDHLSRRYPRIVFHFVTANSDELYRELRERNFDLLIARRFGSLADERLQFESLFDDSFVVVAGAQNRWVRRRKIELADLVNEPWVLRPDGSESVGAAIVTKAFAALGLGHPRTTVFTDSPEARFHLLTTGRFLTVSSSSAVRFTARRSELKVLPIKLPAAEVPNGIVTLKNRTLSPVAQLFIDGARQVAKRLANTKL